MSRARKTPEEYRAQFDAKWEGKFILLNDYVSAHKNVRARCSTCKRVSIKPAYAFLSRPCGKCAIANKRKTHKEYESEFHAVHGKGMKLVSKYKTSTNLISAKCSKCGNVSTKLPSSMLEFGCMYCAKPKIAERKRRTGALNKKEDDLYERPICTATNILMAIAEKARLERCETEKGDDNG